LLQAYIGKRTHGPLFVQEPLRQRGGVSRDRYGAWWGFWREKDDTGKRAMRSKRLGDFELPTKERAQLALTAFLTNSGVNVNAGEMPEPKGLSKRSVYRVVVKAAKRAGITEMHPHILRHSCLTHCLNRGMDLRYVQELAGHTSLSTTQVYLHTAVEHLKEVRTKFFPRGAE
jgi:site-specific recombinase XerC